MHDKSTVGQYLNNNIITKMIIIQYNLNSSEKHLPFMYVRNKNTQKNLFSANQRTETETKNTYQPKINNTR